MAIESHSDEIIPTYDESYCEELASEEELYLEQIEEELRSELIADTPQDDRPQSDDGEELETAFESYREAQASLFQE